MKYLMVNVGCHDDTETELELSDKELEFLLKIVKENNKNGGGCKPVIEIYKEYEKKENTYGYYYDYLEKEPLKI